jgi:hypothetical protein
MWREHQRPQNINLRGGEWVHMNKVTVFCMPNQLWVCTLLLLWFWEASRFLENIKWAKGLQMAAVQMYFCTVSCFIFFTLSALGPVNICPTKKGVKGVYNMLGSML